MVLTGSWNLNTVHTEKYVSDGGGVVTPRWNAYARKTEETVSSSYSIDFRGTQKINMITMLAHAPQGELNYSPNPTYASYDGQTSSEVKFVTSSYGYSENTDMKLVNTISSSYASHDEKFQKQTFISRVGVYDENKNLIAIAKLATPVRKLENDEYTFKLKLDY